jgi:hypothetical protein
MSETLTKKIDSNGKGVLVLTAEEIRQIIDEVAEEKLNKNGEEVIEICERGEWQEDKKNYMLWSWLNNFVRLLSLKNVKAG